MAIVNPQNKTVGIHALGNSEAKEFKEFDLIPVFLDGLVSNSCRVELYVEKFTCRCPITNQPDHATVRVSYDPKDYYLETKSFKLYIESFRERGIFHEHLTSMILHDLVASLSPAYVEVETSFDARGGISVKSTSAWSHLEGDVSLEGESDAVVPRG